MIKKYIAITIFSAVVLLIGVVLSLPISINVTSAGEKPSFLFAAFMLVAFLLLFIGAGYLSYTAWFEGAKTQERVGLAMDQLAKSYGRFRFVVITNRFFLLWFIRIFYPILAVFSFVFFLLFLLGAF